MARFAALACPEGWAVIVMRVGAVRDAELGFDSIDGWLKHGALDGGDVVVEPKGPASNAS